MVFSTLLWTRYDQQIKNELDAITDIDMLLSRFIIRYNQKMIRRRHVHRFVNDLLARMNAMDRKKHRPSFGEFYFMHCHRLPRKYRKRLGRAIKSFDCNWDVDIHNSFPMKHETLPSNEYIHDCGIDEIKRMLAYLLPRNARYTP